MTPVDGDNAFVAVAQGGQGNHAEHAAQVYLPLTASFVYDANGNLLGMTGPQAAANPYRFSSKEHHESSDLGYYGYRFYDPTLQRWINRDHIEESGFLRSSGVVAGRGASWQLYLFVENQPAIQIDDIGLANWNVLKCQQWCDKAIKFCHPLHRKNAQQWCYACCLAVGTSGNDQGTVRKCKVCITATAAACSACRNVKAPWKVDATEVP